jgi:hypothetical protein
MKSRSHEAGRFSDKRSVSVSAHAFYMGENLFLKLDHQTADFIRISCLICPGARCQYFDKDNVPDRSPSSPKTRARA